MKKVRRQRLFGPLLASVLVLAALVLAGLHLQDPWTAWRQQRALRPFAADLRSPNPLVNRPAADKLATAGSIAIPWLIEAASDPDAGVRFLAFSALSRTLPLLRTTIPTLVVGLRDRDARIRGVAADALARFGPEAGAATDGLTAAMKDTDPDVRFRAARSLVVVGGRSNEPVLRVLLASLADPVATHVADRAAIILVIRKMGPAAESRAVAALIPLLEADEPATRRLAIEGLEQFGISSRGAVPALVRALRDDDQVCRYLAALALSEIEGWDKGRARALLEELVDSPSLPPRVKKQVRWVLSTEFVGVSKVSQPVHVLRFVVDEYREAEAIAAIGTAGATEGEVTDPEP